MFKAGDQADKLFYIHKGLIRLPELNVLVRPGQVLGEMGIFSPGRQRTASALCEEDLEAFTMGREEVVQLFSLNPSLALELMQVSNKRFLDNWKAEAEVKERIKSELRIAHHIQNSMLPRSLPAFPDRREFELHATMDPAEEVGGDFYDFFFVTPSKLCVLVGDVSGKGVPAALFMAISKALLKSEALRDYPPHEVIARVNNLLCPDNRLCMFVTVFCVLLDTETGEVEMCNGGHNPPLLCARDGRTEFLETPKGMVVGVMENSHFASRKMTLKPQDLLLLYTDGVTEAINSGHELFSDARLKTCLPRLRDLSVTEVISGIRRELASHTQGQAQSDDITLLALRYRGA